MSSDSKANIIKKNGKLFYFRQVQQELKKVSWTSRVELILGTKIALVSIFLFSMGIYFVDVFIRYMLTSINAIFKLIFG